MATCEVCGNEYDKCCELIAAGARHTFDRVQQVWMSSIERISPPEVRRSPRIFLSSMLSQRMRLCGDIFRFTWKRRQHCFVSFLPADEQRAMSNLFSGLAIDADGKTYCSASRPPSFAAYRHPMRWHAGCILSKSAR